MIKKIIDSFINSFKEGYRIGKAKIGTVIGYVSYNDTNLPILYNPTCVAEDNTFFACCAIYNGEYRIIVDDYYVQAPQYVKDFINQHEIGHLYWLDNGHPNGHTLDDEFMADKYGAQIVGVLNAIKALNYIWIVGAQTGQVDKLLTIPSRLKELGDDVSSMYIIGANGMTYYEKDLRTILLQRR